MSIEPSYLMMSLCRRSSLGVNRMLSSITEDFLATTEDIMLFSEQKSVHKESRVQLKLCTSTGFLTTLLNCSLSDSCTLWYSSSHQLPNTSTHTQTYSNITVMTLRKTLLPPRLLPCFLLCIFKYSILNLHFMSVCPGWLLAGMRRMRKRQLASVEEEHVKTVYEARREKRQLTQPKAWGLTATGVLYKHTHTHSHS